MKEEKDLLNNIMVLLEVIEEVASKSHLKQEGRVAATLFDVCSVYEVSELSSEQKECIVESLKNLITKWGKIDRSEANAIRSKLLNIGLTWLPITDKAQKEIEEARKFLDQDC